MTTTELRQNEDRNSIRQLKSIAKKYHKRSNLRGLFAIGSDWLVIVLFSVLCIISFQNVSLFFAVPLYLVSAVIIASRFRGFENLVHEASHYNLFTKKEWNDLLEILFAIPVFRLVQDYRQSHLTHHLHLGDLSVDPDIQRYERLGINQLPKNYVWIMFGRPLLGYHTFEYVTNTLKDFWTSPTSYTVKSIFWVSILALIAVFNLWTEALLFWIIPFFVILPITRFWAEAAEHSSLDLNHEVGASRNNIGWLLHRFILHPHNDGYHEVHHCL